MATSHRAGRANRRLIYVITCGMCGRSWQTASAQDGQILGCSFCRCQGNLRLGVIPADAAPSEPTRVEGWLQVSRPRDPSA